MRAIGLLFLLGGCLILMMPTIMRMMHRFYKFDDGPLIAGALICLGVATLILTRNRTS